MAIGESVRGSLEVIRTLKPEFVNEVISTAVSATTDIFASDLGAVEDGYWIIRITTDTAGYPIVKETPSGSTSSITSGLNASGDLTVNSWYEFWLTAKKGDKINLQFSVDATVTIRVFFSRSS